MVHKHADKSDDMTIKTRTGLHKLPFEKLFKFWATHSIKLDAREPGREDAECKQSTVERCEDLQKRRRTRGEDVPWRLKCRGMVEQVYSVFCFGSESWSWRRAIMDRIKGWETKAMSRLFRFKEKRG